jgi:ATP-dependent RNA helicase DOB1
VPDAIEGPLSSLRAAARRVARLEGDVGLEGAVAPDDAAASFSADVAEPVLAWARGARFTDALKAGDGLFEGSLVRVLRRVEELARQLGAAAAVVGDVGLADAAAAAGAKIKRGVPFAPSLYL